ncbi:hypothetical protein CAOG_00282 [Capsaspora owczarzaki ATCC 30864]|uniref:hypothetical protein n=1 Tax=Capsaspora owczarzaki (strain ATCC 30864) TaxID=595528 RepID=UPI0001FE4E80|nr:hypothetical protein CAOG_00282 [Capsaspora owczarzaki ATCC 30864]|eukprot:XP_004365153.1 hypothetical protein CAOG_00282 [Capsaspora owczarzaki ATCC 30864]
MAQRLGTSPRVQMDMLLPIAAHGGAFRDDDRDDDNDENPNADSLTAAGLSSLPSYHHAHQHPRLTTTTAATHSMPSATSPALAAAARQEQQEQREQQGQSADATFAASVDHLQLQESSTLPPIRSAMLASPITAELAAAATAAAPGAGESPGLDKLHADLASTHSDHLIALAAATATPSATAQAVAAAATITTTAAAAAAAAASRENARRAAASAAVVLSRTGGTSFSDLLRAVEAGSGSAGEYYTTSIRPSTAAIPYVSPNLPPLAFAAPVPSVSIPSPALHSATPVSLSLSTSMTSTQGSLSLSTLSSDSLAAAFASSNGFPKQPTSPTHMRASPSYSSLQNHHSASLMGQHHLAFESSHLQLEPFHDSPPSSMPSSRTNSDSSSRSAHIMAHKQQQQQHQQHQQHQQQHHQQQLHHHYHQQHHHPTGLSTPRSLRSESCDSIPSALNGELGQLRRLSEGSGSPCPSPSALSMASSTTARSSLELSSATIAAATASSNQVLPADAFLPIAAQGARKASAISVSAVSTLSEPTSPTNTLVYYSNVTSPIATPSAIATPPRAPVSPASAAATMVPHRHDRPNPMASLTLMPDDIPSVLAALIDPRAGGLEIRDRPWLLFTLRSCFVGKEAIDWFICRLNLDVDESRRYGQKLLDLGLVKHSSPTIGFKEAGMYAFDMPVVNATILAAKEAAASRIETSLAPSTITSPQSHSVTSSGPPSLTSSQVFTAPAMPLPSVAPVVGSYSAPITPWASPTSSFKKPAQAVPTHSARDFGRMQEVVWSTTQNRFVPKWEATQ